MKHETNACNQEDSYLYGIHPGSMGTNRRGGNLCGVGTNSRWCIAVLADPSRLDAHHGNHELLPYGPAVSANNQVW